MFNDLFFEDLDMAKGICDKIFDNGFAEIDRDGDGFVTEAELISYLIRIANAEGSIKRSLLEQEL